MVGFGFSFQFFSIFFWLIFTIVFGFIVFTVVRGLMQWNKNNHSPRLTVPATVVTKRTSVHHSHHSNAGGGVGHTSTSTYYYVTFEVESGDRFELSVLGTEYGLLAEGDLGKLTFQGSRYLGFERTF